MDGVLEFTAAEPLPAQNETSERIAWLEQCVLFLRKKLRKALAEDLVDGGTELRVFRIDDELAACFEKSLKTWDDKSTPPDLPKEIEQSARRSVSRLFSPVLERGKLPIVILCDPPIRSALDEFLRVQTFTLPDRKEANLGTEWYRIFAEDELPQFVEPIGVIQLSRTGEA